MYVMVKIMLVDLDFKKAILGEENKFLATKIQDYFEFKDGKKTDNRLGVQITVVIFNPEKDLYYEKFEIKIANVPLKDFQPNTTIKFTNLKVKVNRVEFGKPNFIGYADNYEIVSTK